MIVNILGGIGGCGLFLVGCAVVEHITHDGKGKTLEQHMNDVIFVSGGSVLAFIAGSWIAPYYIS